MSDNPLKEQKRWRTRINEEGDYCIQGKRGVISMRKDGTLDIWITNIRAAIKAEKVWTGHSHYDDGCLIIRGFGDLDVAATFIKAPKRRQVTEAMREKGRQLAARMRSGALNAGLGRGSSEQTVGTASEPEMGL